MNFLTNKPIAKAWKDCLDYKFNQTNRICMAELLGSQSTHNMCSLSPDSSCTHCNYCIHCSDLTYRQIIHKLVNLYSIVRIPSDNSQMNCWHNIFTDFLFNMNKFIRQKKYLTYNCYFGQIDVIIGNSRFFDTLEIMVYLDEQINHIDESNEQDDGVIIDTKNYNIDDIPAFIGNSAVTYTLHIADAIDTVAPTMNWR